MLSLLVMVIVVLIVVGFLVYLLRFLPLAPPYPEVIRAVLVFAAVIFVIYTLWNGRGLFHL